MTVTFLYSLLSAAVCSCLQRAPHTARPSLTCTCHHNASQSTILPMCFTIPFLHAPSRRSAYTQEDAGRLLSSSSPVQPTGIHCVHHRSKNVKREKHKTMMFPHKIQRVKKTFQFYENGTRFFLTTLSFQRGTGTNYCKLQGCKKLLQNVCVRKNCLQYL